MSKKYKKGDWTFSNVVAEYQSIQREHGFEKKSPKGGLKLRRILLSLLVSEKTRIYNKPRRHFGSLQEVMLIPNSLNSFFQNTVDPGHSEPLGTAHRSSLYPGFIKSGLHVRFQVNFDCGHYLSCR